MVGHQYLAKTQCEATTAHPLWRTGGIDSGRPLGDARTPAVPNSGCRMIRGYHGRIVRGRRGERWRDRDCGVYSVRRILESGLVLHRRCATLEHIHIPGFLFDALQIILGQLP